MHVCTEQMCRHAPMIGAGCVLAVDDERRSGDDHQAAQSKQPERPAVGALRLGRRRDRTVDRVGHLWGSRVVIVAKHISSSVPSAQVT